jgi:hypothetical protein
MELLENLILISVVMILVCSCGRASKVHTANDFYSQALDEIVTRSQIYSCANITQQQEDDLLKVYDQYRKGELDSLELVEFKAGAVEAMKDTVTCTFDLSDNFDVYSQVSHSLAPQQIEYIVNALHAEHVDVFIDVPVKQIVDSISMPSKKAAADFVVDYIRLVPYQRTGESFMKNMKGNGIFTFSSALFSEDGQKAVFYYEYVCGGKCGVGEIVTMQLKEARWKIVNMINVWIS